MLPFGWEWRKCREYLAGYTPVSDPAPSVLLGTRQKGLRRGCKSSGMPGADKKGLGKPGRRVSIQPAPLGAFPAMIPLIQRKRRVNAPNPSPPFGMIAERPRHGAKAGVYPKPPPGNLDRQPFASRDHGMNTLEA